MSAPFRRSRGRFQYRWGRLSRAARNIGPNMHPPGFGHMRLGRFPNRRFIWLGTSCPGMA